MATSRFSIPEIDDGRDILDGPADINAALDAIDDAMAGYDSGTSLPSPATAGKLFFRTDTGVLYFDTGSAWTPVAATAGKSIIATSETRSNTSYGLLTTPDRVQNVLLPADGLIEIDFQALWKTSSAAISAAIFIGSNQLKVRAGNPAAYLEHSPRLQAGYNSGGLTSFGTLSTTPVGLISPQQTSGDTVSDVTTGQALGFIMVGGPSSANVSKMSLDDNSVDLVLPTDVGGTLDAMGLGGSIKVFAAAGTYTVSVQFKTAGGTTVTVKERKLWVRALAY